MNKNNAWVMVFVLALATMAVVVALSGTPGVDSANIVNGSIQVEDLKTVNAPTDEYCVTYESTIGDFEYQPCDVAVDDYGNLYADDAVTAAQVLASAGVFEKVIAFDKAGESSAGVTPNIGTYDLTINDGGVYEVFYNVSFEGTANKDFEFAVFVDGVQEAAAHTIRTTSGAGEIGSVNGVFVSTISAAEVVDVRAAPESNGDSLTVHFGSLVVHELAD